MKSPSSPSRPDSLSSKTFDQNKNNFKSILETENNFMSILQTEINFKPILETENNFKSILETELPVFSLQISQVILQLRQKGLKSKVTSDDVQFRAKS